VKDKPSRRLRTEAKRETDQHGWRYLPLIIPPTVVSRYKKLYCGPEQFLITRHDCMYPVNLFDMGQNEGDGRTNRLCSGEQKLQVIQVNRAKAYPSTDDSYPTSVRPLSDTEADRGE